MSNIMVLGGNGLESLAGGDVKIEPGLCYYSGYSDSPKVIYIVEVESGEAADRVVKLVDYTNAIRPSPTIRQDRYNILADMIARGEATRQRHASQAAESDRGYWLEYIGGKEPAIMEEPYICNVCSGSFDAISEDDRSPCCAADYREYLDPARLLPGAQESEEYKRAELLRKAPEIYARRISGLITGGSRVDIGFLSDGFILGFGATPYERERWTTDRGWKLLDDAAIVEYLDRLNDRGVWGDRADHLLKLLNNWREIEAKSADHESEIEKSDRFHELRRKREARAELDGYGVQLADLKVGDYLQLAGDLSVVRIAEIVTDGSAAGVYGGVASNLRAGEAPVGVGSLDHVKRLDHPLPDLAWVQILEAPEDPSARYGQKPLRGRIESAQASGLDASDLLFSYSIIVPAQEWNANYPKAAAPSNGPETIRAYSNEIEPISWPKDLQGICSDGVIGDNDRELALFADEPVTEAQESEADTSGDPVNDDWRAPLPIEWGQAERERDRVIRESIEEDDPQLAQESAPDLETPEPEPLQAPKAAESGGNEALTVDPEPESAPEAPDDEESASTYDLDSAYAWQAGGYKESAQPLPESEAAKPAPVTEEPAGLVLDRWYVMGEKRFYLSASADSVAGLDNSIAVHMPDLIGAMADQVMARDKIEGLIDDGALVIEPLPDDDGEEDDPPVDDPPADPEPEDPPEAPSAPAVEPEPESDPDGDESSRAQPEHAPAVEPADPELWELTHKPTNSEAREEIAERLGLVCALWFSPESDLSGWNCVYDAREHGGYIIYAKHAAINRHAVEIEAGAVFDTLSEEDAIQKVNNPAIVYYEQFPTLDSFNDSRVGLGASDPVTTWQMVRYNLTGWIAVGDIAGLIKTAKNAREIVLTDQRYRELEIKEQIKAESAPAVQPEHAQDSGADRVAFMKAIAQVAPALEQPAGVSTVAIHGKAGSQQLQRADLSGELTIYALSESVGLGYSRIEAKKIETWIAPYAQYNNAVYLRYTPRGKRKARQLVQSDPNAVILHGWNHPEPEKWDMVKESEEVTVKTGKFSAFDPAWRVLFNSWIVDYVKDKAPTMIAIDYRTLNVTDRFPGNVTDPALLCERCGFHLSRHKCDNEPAESEAIEEPSGPPARRYECSKCYQTMDHEARICPACQEEADRDRMEREADPLTKIASGSATEVTKKIRELLNKRSDRSWTARNARGTAYGYLSVSAPPSRLRSEYGSMSLEDAIELAELWGSDRVNFQYISVSPDEHYHALRSARGDFPARWRELYRVHTSRYIYYMNATRDEPKTIAELLSGWDQYIREDNNGYVGNTEEQIELDLFVMVDEGKMFKIGERYTSTLPDDPPADPEPEPLPGPESWPKDKRERYGEYIAAEREAGRNGVGDLRELAPEFPANMHYSSRDDKPDPWTWIKLTRRVSKPVYKELAAALRELGFFWARKRRAFGAKTRIDSHEVAAAVKGIDFSSRQTKDDNGRDILTTTEYQPIQIKSAYITIAETPADKMDMIAMVGPYMCSLEVRAIMPRCKKADLISFMRAGGDSGNVTWSRLYRSGKWHYTTAVDFAAWVAGLPVHSAKYHKPALTITPELEKIARDDVIRRYTGIGDDGEESGGAPEPADPPAPSEAMQTLEARGGRAKRAAAQRMTDRHSAMLSAYGQAPDNPDDPPAVEPEPAGYVVDGESGAIERASKEDADHPEIIHDTIEDAERSASWVGEVNKQESARSVPAYQIVDHMGGVMLDTREQSEEPDDPPVLNGPMARAVENHAAAELESEKIAKHGDRYWLGDLPEPEHAPEVARVEPESKEPAGFQVGARYWLGDLPVVCTTHAAAPALHIGDDTRRITTRDAVSGAIAAGVLTVDPVVNNPAVTPGAIIQLFKKKLDEKKAKKELEALQAPAADPEPEPESEDAPMVQPADPVVCRYCLTDIAQEQTAPAGGGYFVIKPAPESEGDVCGRCYAGDDNSYQEFYDAGELTRVRYSGRPGIDKFKILEANGFTVEPGSGPEFAADRLWNEADLKLLTAFMGYSNGREIDGVTAYKVLYIGERRVMFTECNDPKWLIWTGRSEEDANTLFRAIFQGMKAAACSRESVREAIEAGVITLEPKPDNPLVTRDALNSLFMAETVSKMLSEAAEKQQELEAVNDKAARDAGVNPENDRQWWAGVQYINGWTGIESGFDEIGQTRDMPDRAQIVIDAHRSAEISDLMLWDILSHHNSPIDGPTASEVYKALGFEPFAGYPLQPLKAKPEWEDLGAMNQKTADKLRGLADGLDGLIEKKRNTFAGANLTYRRQGFIDSANIDADEMEEQQAILRALADKWELGEVEHYLTGIKHKKTVERMIRDVHLRTRQKRIARFEKLQKYMTNPHDYMLALDWIEQTLAGAQVGDDDVTRQIERKLQDVYLQRPPGYFATPEPVLDILADYLPARAKSILEPSAGGGAMADWLRDIYPDADLHCFEVNYRLREILDLKGHDIIGDDFVGEYALNTLYDLIVMNPPFEKEADIDHVWKAFECLAPGGRLIAIMSAMTLKRGTKKADAFRSHLEILEDHGYAVKEDLPDDAFKSSGTGVNALYIVLDKPE